MKFKNKMADFFLMLLALVSAYPAFAWEAHQAIQSAIYSDISESHFSFLKQKIKIPCQEQERSKIEELAKKLSFNGSRVPLFSSLSCVARDGLKTVTLKDMLLSQMIDEPDFGMDQDLPESADPNRARDWMGGKTGPTSQGFRHMEFRGLKLSFSGLQIPFHKVGEASARFEIFRQAAIHEIETGDVFFGVRLMLWALHYMQDLHQPFHSTQVPDLRMLPWKSLFSFFIAESTRVMGNFHYAYEDLAFEMVKESALNGMDHCFDLSEDEKSDSPKSWMDFSQSKAKDIGGALVALFPKELHAPEVDLANGQGGVDSYLLLHLAVPEGDSSRIQTQIKSIASIKSTTCELYKSLSRNTRAHIQELFSKLSVRRTGR